MTHPDEQARRLPIYNCEEQIFAALTHNRVVVVEGPTGCGKTTQLPRIIARRLGVRRIGITQPRRLAAVSVAWRIAAEEEVEVGTRVGYAIRFDDQTSPDTVIKIMTDGILLMEARSDPELSAYDVLMIDEAHERSLNIDVILGLVHRLLGRRADLKVIVSSATMYPAQFQRFFAPVAGTVPLVSIPARVHPIQIHYRPLDSERSRDRVDEVADAILAVHRRRVPGHVLAFLSGEADIRAVAASLSQHREGRDLVVLPLFARLTRQEQERVFEDVGSQRKVVLATNIAETSITIPDVRFVVDLGLAKIPSFSSHSGITSLREQPISRASAQQRAGRAGRTGPGEVIRLYSEDSFHDRPEFTSEEILRVDLTEVVLRLIDLGVPHVESFSFPTPPPRDKVHAALDALLAMGAIDRDRRLTAIGRRMVPFPLAPALARMVIEAAERYPKVVDEVLIAGAFLSTRGPYLLPEEHFDVAKRAHRRFAHPLGDVASLLNVYRAYRDSADPAAFCKRSYLDADIMAFVVKAHEQLAAIAGEQGIEIGYGGPAEDLVRAVAAGLADRVMRRRGAVNDYETLSGVRVALHPGSVLFERPPPLVVAGELLQHARAYASQVSVLKREWLADISDVAATRFGGRPGRKREQEEHAALRASSATAPSTPTQLQLGPLTLEVPARRGKPTVELTLEQVAMLRTLRPADLPPEASRIRGQVRWTDRCTFAAIAIPKLLEVVRAGYFPRPADLPPRNPGFGALFESDRDRHRVEAGLAWLLRPATTGKSAGWVALVANGAGGFWLDLVPHFHDAVLASQVSVEALAGDLCDGDPLKAEVETLSQTLDELARGVGSA
jgi:HrpA-like RNA helicase